MMRKFTVALIVITAALVVPLMARAEVGFGTTQSLFDISLPPGAEQEVKLVVFNQSKTDALPIQVQMKLWSLAEDSDKIEFVSPDEELDATTWFTLQGKSDLILPPAGERELTWQVNIPTEAPAGSYLVMARLVPVLPEHYFASEGPRSIPELGVLFFLKVVPFGFEGADNYKASISSFSPSSKGLTLIPGASAGVYGSLVKSYQSLIKNEGLYFFKANGFIEISNWWGRTVASLRLPERYLLPGRIRNLLAQTAETDSWLKSRLRFGLYRARLVLSVPNQSNPVVSEVSFWVFPWELILTVLGFGLLVVAGRRRLASSVKVLFLANPTAETGTPLVDSLREYDIINPVKPTIKSRRKTSLKGCPNKKTSKIKVKALKRKGSYKSSVIKSSI